MAFKLGKEIRNSEPPDFHGIAGSDFCLLLIHDNRSDRQMIKFFLKPYNVVFIEAQDAVTAFMELAKRRPDMMLINAELPGFGDENLIKEILDDIRYLDIPTAVIAKETEKSEAEIKYADYYQAKLSAPISSTRVLNTVKSFLPIRQNIRELTIEEMRPDINFLLVERRSYKANLAVIVDVLENELMAEWKRANVSLQRDNEVATLHFISNLTKFNLKFRVPTIKSYLKEINSAITNRRKIKRDVLMDRYSELVSNLRNELDYPGDKERNLNEMSDEE